MWIRGEVLSVYGGSQSCRKKGEVRGEPSYVYFLLIHPLDKWDGEKIGYCASSGPNQKQETREEEPPLIRVWVKSHEL
jgi:hypothetical protein